MYKASKEISVQVIRHEGNPRGQFLGLTSPTTPAGCASGYLGRRRTDLVPTIPSRDSSFNSSGSRKSLSHSPGTVLVLKLFLDWINRVVV